MRIAIYDGMKEETDFFRATYMSADGLLAVVGGYADDATGDRGSALRKAFISGNPPSTSSSAASASSGASSSRSKSRRAGPGASDAFECSAVQHRVTTADNTLIGYFVELRTKNGAQEWGLTTDEATQEIFDKLSSRIARETFQILGPVSGNEQDGDGSLLAFPDDPDGAGWEILESLSLVPFTAFQRIVDFNNRNWARAQFKNDYLAAVKSIYAPRGPVRVPMVVEIADPPESLGDFIRNIKGDFLADSKFLLWIPDQLAEIFHDGIEDSVVYVADGPRRYVAAKIGDFYTVNALETRGKFKETAILRLGGQTRPFYGILADTLKSFPLMVPYLSWPSTGVGGQGAMRCDADTEFEAGVCDTGGVLGEALGLTAQIPPGSQAVLVIDYEAEPPPSATSSFAPVLTSHSAPVLTYHKAYKNVRKRNLPADYRPLALGPPVDLRAYFAPSNPGARRNLGRDLKPILMEGGFTKKKKGAMPANPGDETPGEPAGSPVTVRKSANAIMKDALGSRLANAPPLPDGWKGSATEFAAWAFAADPVVSSYWKEKSTALLKNDGLAADPTDPNRGKLRTTQEWCHLFGHGDGGREYPGNFVAGSKHCNTEQLALELSQRLFRAKKLRVKITAYLMPSGSAANKRNLQGVALCFPGLKDILTTELLRQPADYRQWAEADDRRRTALRNYALGATWPGDTMISVRGASPFVLRGAVYLRDATPEQRRAAVNGFAEGVLSVLYPEIPIAAYMRYKVYVPKEDGTYVKCIDHIFSGQREEMDYNEFRALQWSFRLKIAAAVGPDEIRSVWQQLREKIGTPA